MKTLLHPQTTAASILAFVIVGLVGCSSKPGESDIKTSLTNEFQCPILEITDLKKTDGVDRGGRTYEVSYTFEVGLKGGGGAAAKLLPELTILSERLERGRLQHDRASNAAAISDNPAPLDAAVMDVWFAKLAGPRVSSYADLEAKAKDIAERHNEQISDIKSIKWGGVDAVEFTAKSTEGVRKLRLFVAGKYEVQAIASPVPGKVANLAEMQRFLDGLKPAAIAD
jgi:hypothetical protein